MRQDNLPVTNGTEEFSRHWRQADDAIAFIEPHVYDELAAAGMFRLARARGLA